MSEENVEIGKGTGLSAKEVEAIAERLKAGQYLPDYLRDRLFQTQQEAELAYAAKVPRSRVLSDTMAVPLQTVKRFGEPSNGWTNRLVFGDNLQVLKELLEMKARGELVNADGSHGVRLCYIDPPFATKRDLKGAKGQVAYRDKIAGAAFVEFLRKRLILIYELLADDGSLFVHLDWHQGHYIKVALDEIFGQTKFRNEIVWWYYNKLQGNIKRFASNHDVIYWYSKSDQYTFNRLREPREKPKRQQKRVWDPETQTLKQAKDDEGNLIYYTETERTVDDVWRLPYLMPADRTENVRYETQKPLAVAERIVAAASNEGDLVADFFCGSGTALVAADRLNRRWIGIDSGKLAIYTTQGRLLKDAGQGGGDPTLSTAAAFDVCAAGLYDNELLEQLEPDDYREFALELFGCRPSAQVVGGIDMAGTRSGDPVHIFPYTQTDGDMGREYIDSLEGRLRDLHSGPCYVIAPASRCDPGLFEDVIDVGSITFFILRIPYSVIEALHQRRFEQLRQPTDETAINEPIDAFGFDFVRVPEVVATFKVARNVLSGEVKSFFRGDLDPDDRVSAENAGRDDLAMVMLDRDYDGEVFQISDYWFGEALEKGDWKFSMPLAECGERVLVIYIDTQGNERREAIDVAAVRKKSAPRKKSKKSGAKSG
jgi:DNA modification methylase